MPFRLRPDERLDKGLTRIVKEEVRKIVDELRRPRLSDEAVHEARKHIKKIRAVLRLVEATTGNRLGRADKRLRRIGRALSPLRDAKALVETLAHLEKRHDDDFMIRRAVAIVSRRLAERRRRLRQVAHQANLGRRSQKAVRRVKRSIRRSPLETLRFSSALAGMRAAYRDGRRAMEGAREKQRDTDFHRWRKRIKTLWYQLRLLQERIDVGDRIAALNRLEESLGDDHNLVVLRTYVAHDPAHVVHGEHMARLDEVSSEYQQQLRHDALALGARVYASKPKDFARALRAEWERRSAAAGRTRRGMSAILNSRRPARTRTRRGTG
jgi:CHAD domain-containing protein